MGAKLIGNGSGYATPASHFRLLYVAEWSYRSRAIKRGNCMAFGMLPLGLRKCSFRTNRTFKCRCNFQQLRQPNLASSRRRCIHPCDCTKLLTSNLF
ncbi:hypothetical protein NPIL_96351 [Nephila pilipes]|uniref:Uncharacterized protein n=1 Tax=Nephila pilipes TaxID=299642 RepID=A0A8X6ND94_NEPPI|nr:hypothetical protein NPIL_96351 [Nephila pilipes]